MKDIYWKKLTTGEQVLFVLGWFWILNLVFWVSFIVTYIIGRDRKGREFREFFNPHTFKVPYVFGWISVALLILMVLLMGFMILFGMVFLRGIFV
jgi:hypothetical protein